MRRAVQCFFACDSFIVLSSLTTNYLVPNYRISLPLHPIQELVNYVDSVVYGLGIPWVAMVVVVVTTVVTNLRLRKAAAWRSESSSGTLSSREVALTKMLIGNSILFIVCILPMSFFKYVTEICS